MTLSGEKPEPAAAMESSLPAKDRGRLVSRRFRWWIVFAVLFGLFAAASLSIHAARKPIAAFLVQSYLLRHGVTSVVTFERLERGGFAARVRIGPETPEFTAEILDVTLSYNGVFALPTIGTVKLVRPVLHATFDGRKLFLGSLQPLVEEVLAREPEGPGPSFSVENGTLFLATPNGPLQFAVNAAVEQGRLQNLSATILPAVLRGEAFTAEIAEGAVSASVADDALNGTIALNIKAVTVTGDAAFESRELEATAAVRGLEWRTGEDALSFEVADADIAIRTGVTSSADFSVAQSETRLVLENLQGNYASERLGARARALSFSIANANITNQSGAARIAEVSVARSDTNLVLDNLQGSYANERLRATASANLTNEFTDVNAANNFAGSLSIRTSLDAAAIEFSRGERSAGGPLRIAFDGARMRYPLQSGEVALRTIQGAFEGTGKIAQDGIEGALEGSIKAGASLPRPVALNLVGQLPLIGAEPKLSAAMLDAIRNVDVQIPRLSVARSGDETSFAVRGPTTLSSASGARFTLSPQGNRPLLSGDAANFEGAFGLHIRGGGLPETQVAVSAYRARLQADGLTLNASTQVETSLDFASLHGLHLAGGGQLESRTGRVSFALTRCADVSFDSYVNNGITRVTDTKGRLCAETGQPFFISDDAGWRLNAAWTGASARFEQGESTIAGANGRIALSGDASGPRSGRMDLDRALLSDLQPAPRFLPINLNGSMNLAGQEWAGVLGLTIRNRRFASLALRHAMDTGAGQAAIDAAALSFDPATFQPTDISPLLASFGTRVRGPMSFTGRVSWNTQGIESDGRLRVMNVDLQTWLGAVRGASGDLALTSLMPVTLAPSQIVTIDRLDRLVPLEQATARFSLDPMTLHLESATASMAGGRVSLDPLSFSFAPGSTTEGTLRLQNVDLTPLLAAAGLAERVKVLGRIGGVIPFTSGPEGLRFANGRVAAEGPGRMSIAREALTAAVGTGAGGEAPPGAVQDFAYQALENLAFDQLDGMVNSLPNGRLGVLLHVKGEHDPAVGREPRVGVLDLLRGRAFDKPLPLPKGTPIDLTLDTSLNLDELLASYYGSSSGAAAPAP